MRQSIKCPSEHSLAVTASFHRQSMIRNFNVHAYHSTLDSKVGISTYRNHSFQHGACPTTASTSPFHFPIAVRSSFFKMPWCGDSTDNGPQISCAPFRRYARTIGSYTQHKAPVYLYHFFSQYAISRSPAFKIKSTAPSSERSVTQFFRSDTLFSRSSTTAVNSIIVILHSSIHTQW